MKFNAFIKRLAVLEERAKPRQIATLADFVLWRANGCEEEVEIAPVLEEAFRGLSRRR